MKSGVESQAASATTSLKLMTLNTHKGFSSLNRRFILPALREAVREAAADIVFLQEVIGSHERHAATYADWPGQPQYQYLAETIWNDVAYGRNAIYTGGDHGNAVLSKFPILHHDNHDISIADQEKRGLLHCVIQPPAGPEIHVICVHLGLREAHRLLQVEQLCALVDGSLPPDAVLVIAGDFNDWGSRCHARLARCAGLREVFVERDGAAARSFPVWLPLLRLDRIYVRHARVLSAAVLSRAPWSRLSDHAALAVSISV